MIDRDTFDNKIQNIEYQFEHDYDIGLKRLQQLNLEIYGYLNKFYEKKFEDKILILEMAYDVVELDLEKGIDHYAASTGLAACTVGNEDVSIRSLPWIISPLTELLQIYDRIFHSPD